jgi:hypothetical protein
MSLTKSWLQAIRPRKTGDAFGVTRKTKNHCRGIGLKGFF